MRFLRRLLQHQAGVLRIEDLLVHLLAEPAELDRDNRERILSRDHTDCVWAPHALAVRGLVVLLRRVAVRNPPLSTRHNGTYFDRDRTSLLLIRPFEYKLVPPGSRIQVDDFAFRISFRRFEVYGDFEAPDEPSESFPFLL